MTYTQIIVFFLIVLLFAPIIEEVVFRGFFYSPFQRKIGNKGSLVLIAIIWALWHNDLNHFGGRFIESLILSVLYIKTQSLITPIVTHFFNNAIWVFTLILTKLSVSDVPIIERENSKSIILIFFIISVVTLSIINKNLSQKNRREPKRP